MLVAPHNNACCGKCMHFYKNFIEMTITKYAFLEKIKIGHMLECLAWSSAVGTSRKGWQSENCEIITVFP